MSTPGFGGCISIIRRVPRLALTGAGGFVGRHVVSAATAEGWDVAGLVRTEESARTVTHAGGAPVMVPKLTVDALTPAFAGAGACASGLTRSLPRGWQPDRGVVPSGARRAR